MIMKFCNNCGDKLQDNVKFCTKCGAQVGTAIKNYDKEEGSHGNIHNYIFSHDGINVDLKDLSSRHGENKIRAIKELRDRTGMGLKEAKEVVDELYFGEKTVSNNINEKENNNNRGCMNILLWILFLPIMLIRQILRTEKYGISTKILLIITSIIISLFHIFIYVELLSGFPQIIIIIAIIYLVYRIKKKKEGEAIEAKRLEKEKDRIKLEKNNQMVSRTLNIFFNNKEMNTRLKEFVLQHTKKHDNDQTDHNDYLEKVNLFLVYINRMIKSQIKIRKEDFPQDIIEYWDEKEDIVIESKAIEEFIETKKIEIYSDDLKKLINVVDYENLDDLIHEYIDIFGENALKDLNLKIFSDSLNETHEDISIIVNKEFSKIKKDYEMKKLEEQLFNPDASLKGIEYIDTLSGFDFEDYLEKLFTEFGYMTKDLPYSNDYGADLIISKGFKEIVIQAKNYNSNVGNKAVQEVIAAKSHYKCDIGMVITNAYYTQNAIITAEASEIILVNRDELEKIINEGSMYFNSLVS